MFVMLPGDSFMMIGAPKPPSPEYKPWTEEDFWKKGKRTQLLF